MNEFEWLKQTRALRQPVDPPRDLWPGIAARIGTQAAPGSRRPPRLLPWAMAAALAALSVLAGALAWQQQVTPPAPRVATHVAPAAIRPWTPRNPHLVGAAIELNIARRQLARAIRRDPDSAYLRHMLAHANQQVRRLQQLPHRAG